MKIFGSLAALIASSDQDANRTESGMTGSTSGATVTLSFDGSNGYARAHVSDQGPGIDPADQQRHREANEDFAA